MNKRFLLFWVVFCSCLLVRGQGVEKNVSHSIVLGYPNHILSSSRSALYLAYNPSVAIRDLVSLEGQLAYSFSNYKAFLSGDYGRLEFASLHAGVRFQRNNSNRKLSPYVSLLAGLSSGVHKQHIGQSNEKVDRFTVLSFSGGFFLEYIRKITVGMVIENHLEPLVVLKAKYTF